MVLKFIKELKNLYLSPRFFTGLLVVASFIVLSYAFSLGYSGLLICISITCLWIVAVLADFAVLFMRRYRVTGHRVVTENLSLGDYNKVLIKIESTYATGVRVVLIDELPAQLEIRDFKLEFQLRPGGSKEVVYDIAPKTRGVYEFGHANVFISLKFPGFVRRRFQVAEEQQVNVLPSVLQMKEMELLAFAKISQYSGLKKIRRIGHSYEFEQIREYVEGDDYRSINWKATGRAGTFMVNQYEDEKAQPVYSVIDTSRNMKMPFNGLSLLDYAINTSLVISNLALKKGDQAGLLTYSDQKGTFLKANTGILQLRKIIRELYNIHQSKYESDYERLYHQISAQIVRRSLLFLYLNFESVYSVERVLPMLRKINRKHLLIVVFFENSEILEFAEKAPRDVKAVYEQIIAEKFIYEKQLIARELHLAKIQTILTRPEDLSIQTVNKYLELKARGLI